jgi:hypothetical protein
VQLEILPGNGPDDATEGTARRRLEDEGFSAFCWSDAPAAHYEERAHDHDECIWLIAGKIRFSASGCELVLAPGDRLMLPAGTQHTADAGPDVGHVSDRPEDLSVLRCARQRASCRGGRAGRSRPLISPSTRATIGTPCRTRLHQPPPT